MKLIKSALKTNLSLKSISLLLGFFCWFVFSSTEHSTLTLDVPLCFFSGTDQKKATGPLETVQVQLSGKRADLYSLDRESVALHVDLDELGLGDHLLDINPEKLFLPASLKVVHLNPINPVITVVEKSA